MVRFLIVLFLFLLTNFSFSQRRVILTQTQNDAIKGIDRKAWQGLGNVLDHSDGYANDFTLPARTNFCEKITNVKVDVLFTGYSKTSACPHYETYFNLFYGCTPYAGGATCLPAKVISEMPYPVNTNPATLNFASGDFGENLSVDIIPISNPGCNLVTSGGLTYEYITTVTVTIEEDLPTTPTFASVSPICSGTALAPLPTTSINGITGTWSPALNNAATTTYTFAPAAGLCAAIVPMTITVNPIVTPLFGSVSAICNGAIMTPLPTASTNGITGTWAPALNNAATTTYTFTPTAGLCAAIVTMTITVNPIVTPLFGSVSAICNGAIMTPLPTTSTNGITGTWAPALNNTLTTLYTFTPTAGQCANTAPLIITMNPNVTPTFASVSPICSGTALAPLPTTSINGITGTWSPALNKAATTTYTFTPTAGQCATSITINVTVNPSNTLVSISWTVTEAFAKNQIVTVTDPVGANYLYQMDSGPFQTSPVFEYVASGMHSVTVNDVNGCSELTNNNVLLIGYPKFFTPNGDGYNDVWNITTLNNQLNTRIYIFDRYGKLLKDISPNDAGWDGTYIGLQMPAGDYWFTVDYLELNIVKNFKSHFSLKR